MRKKYENSKDEHHNEGSLSDNYNAFKEFKGKKYTGMRIGGHHNWNYEQGEWKEKKVTPDLWEFNYNVNKHRKGKAPEGSGVPVGTEYHWYIFAHQNVRKLDANTYSTAMKGYKYKLAHKRADKDSWNITYRGQRKRLIRLFENILQQLEQEEIEEQKLKKSNRKKTKQKAKSHEILE